MKTGNINNNPLYRVTIPGKPKNKCNAYFETD